MLPGERYTNEELDRIAYVLPDTVRELRILIQRAWEQGFGAGRASKPAIEEILERN